jgi:arabinogalactan oligomer / maltooligosaccharide transport system permease protein
MTADPSAIGLGDTRAARPAADAATVVDRQRSPLARWARATGWRHLVGLLGVAFAVFPVVWVFSASINPSGTLSGQRLVPEQASLANYQRLLGGDVPFVTWLGNTLVVALSATLLTVLLCALGAYAFSRLRFTGRRTGLLSLLLVQMFPQLLAVVALFLLMLNIRDLYPAIGLGTRPGLILIYLGGALGVNTWLMKGFFDTIPFELDESARVDGATHAQTFFRIILPLVTPVLAVVGIISFVFIVNDFLIASVILQREETFTLSVGLAGFIGERYDARWGAFSAGAIMGGIPVVLLWMFLQRYIVEGLTSGAVKG